MISTSEALKAQVLFTDVTSSTVPTLYGIKVTEPFEEDEPEKWDLYQSHIYPFEGDSPSCIDIRPVVSQLWRHPLTANYDLLLRGPTLAEVIVLEFKDFSRGAESCRPSIVTSIGYERLREGETSSCLVSSLAVEKEVMACFIGMTEDEVEDGMTATLGRRIMQVVVKYGKTAVSEVEKIILSEGISPAIASHTLRWLGRINDPKSFRERLELLTKSLRLSSPLARDGAALGLAALGSPAAIPALRAAVERERLSGLRTDLQRVLNELAHLR